MLFGGLVVAAILMATPARAQDEPVVVDATASLARDEATAGEVPTVGKTPSVVESAPVLSYQGQLLDPFTNLPKPNGAYTSLFAIYNVGAGGARLWQEVKTINTVDGYFSALLGNVQPLDLNIFDEQVLFLARCSTWLVGGC